MKTLKELTPVISLLADTSKHRKELDNSRISIAMNKLKKLRKFNVEEDLDIETYD